MLQESFEKSEFKTSQCTALGWTCVAKLLECQVKSVPIGYFLHETGVTNPLLRILTPNSLRLISLSDQSPVGMFDIPGKAADMVGDIEQKYETWYNVFNDTYVPLLLGRKKWHVGHENLMLGDVIYFF